MDEQKLNEAAEQYAGISEDKFSNSAKKYDAYDMTDAFSSGAHWHEQQNPWRKVEDELPEESCELIYVNNYTITKYKFLVKTSNGKYAVSKRKQFMNHEFYWSGSDSFNVTIIEWKRID